MEIFSLAIPKLHRAPLRVLALCLLTGLALACAPPAPDSAGASAESASTSRSTAPESATQPQDGPTGESVTLMTWNVKFLWDGEAPEDGDADFPWKGNPQAARAHMQEIAERIRTVDPDILGLVEVESLKALKTFNQDFLAGAGYKAYLVEGSDSATGQDVALLSKVDVLSMDRDPRKGKSGSTRKSVSKNYVAKLDLGGKKVGIVGLHFLARPDRENRRDPRQAQAEAVSGMAQELVGQGRSVIVWGDFNDYDGEVLDHDDSRPITRVLEIIRDLDPSTSDDDLFNVAEKLSQNERYTVSFGRRGSRKTAIDHILVSPDLAEHITEVNIPHERAWRDASDHYPIVVRLDF